MELCLRPGGWLSALARLFAAEDPAPQSRAQARPEVNARAEKLLDAYGDLLLRMAQEECEHAQLILCILQNCL